MYQKKIEDQQRIAKEKLAKKDKNGAMMCLKRKKMYENEITKMEGIQVTLETQMMSLESAQTNAAAFQAIKIGTDTLKNRNQTTNVENVETTIEELQEQMDDQREISDAISTAVDHGYDNADLEGELEDLLNESTQEDLTSGIAAPAPAVQEPVTQESILNFPTAPTTPVAAPEASSAEDDAEMRQLAAAMGL